MKASSEGIKQDTFSAAAPAWDAHPASNGQLAGDVRSDEQSMLQSGKVRVFHLTHLCYLFSLPHHPRER
jgi:hypothetical protein